MNKMQGGDLGLQDRIQIYNASYSHYQPCHAAAEISSRKAIIMLYFSGRVCYDLADVRPVTTEYLLKRWKDVLPLRYGGL